MGCVWGVDVGERRVESQRKDEGGKGGVAGVLGPRWWIADIGLQGQRHCQTVIPLPLTHTQMLIRHVHSACACVTIVLSG